MLVGLSHAVVVAGPNGAGKSTTAPALVRDLMGIPTFVDAELASRTFAPWLRKLKEREGYRVSIVYLWLPSPEHAIARVRDRVLHGGHDVPEAVIRRRYHRGLNNFSTCINQLQTPGCSWTTQPSQARIQWLSSISPVELR